MPICAPQSNSSDCAGDLQGGQRGVSNCQSGDGVQDSERLERTRPSSGIASWTWRGKVRFLRRTSRKPCVPSMRKHQRSGTSPRPRNSHEGCRSRELQTDWPTSRHVRDLPKVQQKIVSQTHRFQGGLRHLPRPKLFFVETLLRECVIPTAEYALTLAYLTGQGFLVLSSRMRPEPA